jgi:uncharacterized membrane protein YvbJ
MTQTCANCGAVVREGARFCSECGKPLQPAQVIDAVDVQATPLQSMPRLDNTALNNPFPQTPYSATGSTRIRPARKSSSPLRWIIGAIAAIVLIIIAFKLIGILFGLLWGIVVPLLFIAALVYLVWRFALGGRRRARRYRPRF